MARKKSGASFVGLLLLGLVALLASIPKEIWFAVAVLAVIAGATYFYMKSKKSEHAVVHEERMASPESAKRSLSPVRTGELTYRAQSGISEPTGYSIPAPPKGFGATRWYGPGEVVEVAGRRIPGGMVYVGESFPCSKGGNDPCLIDPSKPVNSRGDFTLRQMGYWPNYSNISASARAAYLDWLAVGRRNSNADIGYVFLFFYGLERRAIVDAVTDEKSKDDWPAIERELRELLALYGKKSGSFKHYASDLLAWVQMSILPEKLYEKPLGGLPKSFKLPLQLRVALGQAAVDGAPLPAHLALSWVKLAPDFYLRTPAVRCSEEFEKVFTRKYHDSFGAGIALPRNRTKLRFVYQPASAGLFGLGELRLNFDDLPDVSVLTAPIKTLRELAKDVTNELDAYSRFLGRNPDARGSLEAILELPTTLWPDDEQQALEGLKARMGDGLLMLSCQELLDILTAKGILTKDRISSLARALESVNIGMEPDVLGGSKAPKPEDNMVLFALPAGEQISRSTPTYQAAQLTLQLSSAVAIAEGEFGAAVLGRLCKHLESWTHLAPSHQRRLIAHLRLLSVAPVTLTSLRKKIEPLEQSGRETIAAFIATVAQADGSVSPAEVKILEKIYKALRVEPKKMFSDVHVLATGTVPVAHAKIGFKLDPARIAALQQDTERVSVLLSNIFTAEEVPTPPPLEAEAEQEADSEQSGLLGLDEAHSALARLLLTQPQWRRAELLDAAADLELMLDGALEQINEVSFDKFDISFTEGDDPLTVNPEVLEKIAA
jgi:tellurite resistance protein